jgi:hypothetical protein
MLVGGKLVGHHSTSWLEQIAFRQDHDLSPTQPVIPGERHDMPLGKGTQEVEVHTISIPGFPTWIPIPSRLTALAGNDDRVES